MFLNKDPKAGFVVQTGDSARLKKKVKVIQIRENKYHWTLKIYACKETYTLKLPQ